MVRCDSDDHRALQNQPAALVWRGLSQMFRCCGTPHQNSALPTSSYTQHQAITHQPSTQTTSRHTSVSANLLACSSCPVLNLATDLSTVLTRPSRPVLYQTGSVGRMPPHSVTDSGPGDGVVAACGATCHPCPLCPLIPPTQPPVSLTIDQRVSPAGH